MDGYRKLRANAVAVLVCAVGLGAVEVTIDRGRTYQTIEGLGVCGVPAMWRVQQGPFYVKAPFEPFADTLINHIGITMLRGFDTESCAFNPAPGQYVVTDGIRGEMERNRYLKAVADSAGQVLRFSPNIFSPPGWMKANGECIGGEESTYSSNSQNSLLPEHFDDFAALCTRFIEISRDTFGLDVYAISPQNEPFFNEPYASCSYSGGGHYAQMLRVVGPAVKQASPSTLIYGVEHMAWAYPSWENSVMADAQAHDYLDRFAVHGYTDGVQVDTATFDSLPDTHVRPLWLSEFNWGEQTYDEALSYGRVVMKALAQSNMSGYLAGGGLWDDGIGTKYHGYYVNAQFFRFVRPGMKRVAANCADSDIMVGAFADESIGSFSIVFINNATTAKSVTLSTAGDTLPGQLEMRRTTASEGFVDGGMVASTVSISLPAQSIVSLGHKVRVGSGTHVKRPRAVARVPLSQRRPGGSTAFDLRGRRVTRTESCRRRGAAVMSSGAYPRAASVLVVAGQGASAGLDLSVVRAP